MLAVSIIAINILCILARMLTMILQAYKYSSVINALHLIDTFDSDIPFLLMAMANQRKSSASYIYIIICGPETAQFIILCGT